MRHHIRPPPGRVRFAFVPAACGHARECVIVKRPASVLITGGAGFIGCALAQSLLDRGATVSVLDTLHPQVHAVLGRPPRLPAGAQLLTGDVTHAEDWQTVLRLVRPHTIVHLAAETGTGQSLTEAGRHGAVNVLGTCRMLDALLHAGAVPEHIVLASSRAVYGEGAWQSDGVVFHPGQRTRHDLQAGRWDPLGPDGAPASPVPSRADVTVPRPISVYGATKLAQEHVLGAWAGATGCALSVLRLQNVYGPGQSLTNPYTGVVTLFAQVASRGGVIDVYEDGAIVRDFVFIDDVVGALDRAVASPPAGRRVLDIGSGRSTTIAELARSVAGIVGAPAPEVSGRFRDGDVRAASCDIEPAVRALGLGPTWEVGAGLLALIEWMHHQAEAGA
jgi:dTDP-L-rhamnose 4-epimerase